MSLNRVFWLVCASLTACGDLPGRRSQKTGSCDSQLVLPAGFCATVFADSLGALRHIAIRENGDVYIARWDRPGSPGGLLALRDTNADGRADVARTVSNSGGSGIALTTSHVYMSTWTSVLRYPLSATGLGVTGRADTVLTGLPRSGHAGRSIALHAGSQLYVNIGAPTNSCQFEDKRPGSMGRDPCPERESFAGVWHFDARRLKQRQADGERLVTGLRHAVALTVQTETGSLFAVQHGRDDLAENFPRIYDARRGQRLAAEAMYELRRGSDFGWPYCYYDDSLRRNVLSPEYGGDGVRSARCASAPEPLVAFPAHWAPNGLHFYRGLNFPERYRGGAFIAFHGGWYHPPPDNGFNVVFVPFRGSRPAGGFVVFADGFAGAQKRPNRARHRPVGLAEAPDGALYLTDDQGSRVWRIAYTAP